MSNFFISSGVDMTESTVYSVYSVIKPWLNNGVDKEVVLEKF